MVSEDITIEMMLGAARRRIVGPIGAVRNGDGGAVAKTGPSGAIAWADLIVAARGAPWSGTIGRSPGVDPPAKNQQDKINTVPGMGDRGGNSLGMGNGENRR
jgi:hypothetical protein